MLKVKSLHKHRCPFANIQQLAHPEAKIPLPATFCAFRQTSATSSILSQIVSIRKHFFVALDFHKMMMNNVKAQNIL
jgi:hypothetical protein